MLKAGVVTALGAMSGTSLDGVDAAVIETDGDRIFGFGPSAYRAYSVAEQDVLRGALGLWQDDDVADVAAVVESAHVALMSEFQNVALAGFHGQTLAHDPGGRGTHQCGDGGRMADALGHPVVWDFRSEDIRHGGQGAPLAPFYHFALAQWLQLDGPVAFLNLGGVGNITWVDPRCEAPESDGALLAFDTGPANAPINDLMRMRRGVAFDDGGRLGSEGVANDAVIKSFLMHRYLDRPPPKSLDRDDFSRLTDAVKGLADADAVATLSRVVVEGVKCALVHCPSPPKMMLVAGGGRKNNTIMAGLADALGCEVKPVEAMGLDGDMLEAQAFAYLAVRIVRGMPTSARGTTGAIHPVRGGIIANPK